MPGGSADLYKWLFLAGLFCCSSCQSVSSTFENKTGESSISLFLAFLSFSFFFEQRTQTYYVYPIDMLKRGSRDRSRPNSDYDINKYIRNMRLYRPETTTIDVWHCGRTLRIFRSTYCRKYEKHERIGEDAHETTSQLRQFEMFEREREKEREVVCPKRAMSRAHAR